MFKKDGRTGGTAIVPISLMQTFLIAIVLTPVQNDIFSKQFLDANYKQFGWLGGGIFLILFAVNYRKFNGSYNRYRAHWNYENRTQRILEGFLVILAVILPIIAYGLLNTHWDK